MEIKVLPPSWPPLAAEEAWQANDAISGFSPLTIPHHSLAPLWQLLLVGDGSPTRLLAILTGCQTTIDLIDAQDIARGDNCTEESIPRPSEVAALQGPIIRRRIVMRAGDGPPLMYAVSWWNAADYAKHMPVPYLPIGRTIATGKLEIHRSLHAVYRAACRGPLAELFGVQCSANQSDGLGSNTDSSSISDSDDVWARHYTMMHGGKPLCVIGEAFSPRLRQFLGPQRVVAAGKVPAVHVSHADDGGEQGTNCVSNLDER